ncbi:MAG: choice-of-anchor Q domain-containing protein, partial [Vulcanimicrobiaceae bacterium]
SSGGPGTTTVFSGNTIIAGGTATTSGPDIWNIDTFTSAGYNVVQQSSNYGSGTSNAPQTGDLIGQDPLLSSAGLANNGGPTQTIADTSSSPGKDHIPFSSGSCNGAPFTSIDQRIFTRGSGGTCDVGAYELSGTQDTSPPVIEPGALKRKP